MSSHRLVRSVGGAALIAMLGACYCPPGPAPAGPTLEVSVAAIDATNSSCTPTTFENVFTCQLSAPVTVTNHGAVDTTGPVAVTVEPHDFASINPPPFGGPPVDYCLSLATLAAGASCQVLLQHQEQVIGTSLTGVVTATSPGATSGSGTYSKA